MADDDAAFEAWERSAAVQSHLRTLWDAERRARTTNDPTARDVARTALGEAAGAFFEVTGVAEQLRQQMLDHVLGIAGNKSLASKTFAELTRSGMAGTEGGRAILRGLAERGVLSFFALFGAEFAKIIVADLRKLPSGREGILAYLPKARVARDSGPTHDLQEATVIALGYTVGAEAIQLKGAVLKRAVDFYNTRGAIFGIPRTSRPAMRDWTQRAHAEVYQIAVQEGATDRARGCVDISRKL